jgi:hypothetical protein
METSMTQDTKNMVLRTALVPESLDLELRGIRNLMRSTSTSVDVALQEVVYAELDRMSEAGSVLPKAAGKPEVRVVRSIWVTPERDRELQNRAFQRGQTKGELLIDMISREVHRHRGSLEVGI